MFKTRECEPASRADESVAPDRSHLLITLQLELVPRGPKTRDASSAGPAHPGVPETPTGEDTGSSERTCDLIMTRAVYREILDALGRTEPEAGGILLGPRNHTLVTHFRFDASARVTATTFTPDVSSLNSYLRGALEFGLDMKGIVHSHPSGICVPSAADIRYALKTFESSMTDEFLMPIVCDGCLHPYVITRDARAVVPTVRRPLPRARLVLV